MIRRIRNLINRLTGRTPSKPQTARVVLPVHDGPGISTCCHVYPGQEHTLVCSHVSEDLFLAFLAQQAGGAR